MLQRSDVVCGAKMAEADNAAIVRLGRSNSRPPRRGGEGASGSAVLLSLVHCASNVLKGENNSSPFTRLLTWAQS